jgi:hypothetical protein
MEVTTVTKRTLSWFVLGALPLTLAAQERKVPKDSVELMVRGCLKGRVLTVTQRGGEEDGPLEGPDVTGRHFRVNGPKAVTDEVKKHDRHLVEVVGLVRSIDLADTQPGVRVGGTRIVIGPSVAGPQGRSPSPGPGVPVMDASSVRFLSNNCVLPED